MKEPIIRCVKPNELDAVVQLCKLHAEFEQSEYIEIGKKEALKKHLFSVDPSLYCLVAEVDSEIVGYATFMKQFSTWDAEFYVYMDCLFLTENARGYGIGEKLIDKIKQESKQLGAKLIQWQTPDFNKRAMKFYNRIGAESKTKERYFLDVN